MNTVSKGAREKPVDVVAQTLQRLSLRGVCGLNSTSIAVFEPTIIGVFEPAHHRVFEPPNRGAMGADWSCGRRVISRQSNNRSWIGITHYRRAELPQLQAEGAVVDSQSI